MRFGAHVSVAGGLPAAFERGLEHGCQTLQVFVTNPRAWAFTTLKDETVETFRKRREELAARKSTAVFPIVAHMPYLPNLSSTKPDFLVKSKQSLAANLDACNRLGIEYLVVHMGKHDGAGIDPALDKMTKSITEVLDKIDGDTVLLMENTAGQGTETGRTLAEMGRLLGLLGAGERVGVCLDSCHLFAAGYDFRTREGMASLLEEIEQHIGIARLHVFHLNDSKRECGSHVDRHSHIGEGHIGEAGFRRLLRCAALKHLPGILETPQDTDDSIDRNLATLRRLAGTRRSGTY